MQTYFTIIAWYKTYLSCPVSTCLRKDPKARFILEKKSICLVIVGMSMSISV